MSEAFQDLWCNQLLESGWLLRGSALHRGQSAHPSANRINKAKADRPAWEHPCHLSAHGAELISPQQSFARLSPRSSGLIPGPSAAPPGPARPRKAQQHPNPAPRNQHTWANHGTEGPRQLNASSARDWFGQIKPDLWNLKEKGNGGKENYIPVNVLAVFKQNITDCRELKGESRTSLPDLKSLSAPKISKFSNIPDRNEFRL